MAEVLESEDGDEKQDGEKRDRKKDLEVSISYFRYKFLPCYNLVLIWLVA